MNSAAGRVALGRSSSGELEIELARVVRLGEQTNLPQHLRFINLGIKLDDGALSLSIRGVGPRMWGGSVWSRGTGLRILVPENVRLELVSDNDLAVCRDFPAVLVLRGNGPGAIAYEGDVASLPGSDTGE